VSILILGLLLGMKHATEADHLAAVATLAARQASLGQTLRQGLAWGVGHTLTLLLFGGVVFVLGQSISPTLEQALETAVGVMLVLLGADLLRRVRRERIHFHLHRHDAGGAHVHAHSHRGEGAHARSAHRHAHPARWPLRALAVGAMHGLAGSAALVMLSLQGLPSVSLGLGYIAVFGAGSIVGMAALSVAIAMPLRFSANYLVGLHRSMTALVGVFSIGLGIYLVIEIGYLQAHWPGA
jgi:hypothetical protein